MMVVNAGIFSVNNELFVVGAKLALQMVKLSRVREVNECKVLGENPLANAINGLLIEVNAKQLFGPKDPIILCRDGNE